MLTDEARAFLQRPLIARLSVIDPDGYPHTVPVWYLLDGDDIVMISEQSTRKVRYARQNPKGAVVIGGDSGDGSGYLLKGDLSIEADPDDVWTKRLTYHYESEEQAARDVAAWADLDIIVIRLKPNKVIKVA